MYLLAIAGLLSVLVVCLTIRSMNRPQYKCSHNMVTTKLSNFTNGDTYMICCSKCGKTSYHCTVWD